jgi:hypothetical protein
VILNLLLTVLDDGVVLGMVEPLRIAVEEAETVMKDDHLKAAFAKRHAGQAAKAVHAGVLTGGGSCRRFLWLCCPHCTVDDRVRK